MRYLLFEGCSEFFDLQFFLMNSFPGVCGDSYFRRMMELEDKKRKAQNNAGQGALMKQKRVNGPQVQNRRRAVFAYGLFARQANSS